MFLDADDKISPETVSRLVQALSGKSGYMAACEWRYLSQRGNKWKEFKPPQLPKTLDDIERELHGAHMPPGAWLQPRDIVTRIGGWDETLVAYQDVDFRLRCLLSGAKFIRVRGGRFYYRLHTLPSVSKTVSESALRSRLRVLEKIEQLMQQEELLDVYHLALAKAYRDLASSSTSVAPALSAHCLATMERLSNGAPIPAGQTWQHRLACRLLGVERKERLARFLARYGVGRSIRKAYQSSQTRAPNS